VCVHSCDSQTPTHVLKSSFVPHSSLLGRDLSHSLFACPQAATNPERHLQCAKVLGADAENALRTRQAPTTDGGDYAGELLAEQILQLMERLGVPSGLGQLGYSHSDIPALVEGTLPQRRVTALSPKQASAEALALMFEDALEY
jgi:hydroxyacid-oxoacid transhydrogenase